MVLNVAGDDLTAAQLNAITESIGWTDYTPTWASSGTQPAIGNGTLKGAWCRVGKLLHVRLNQVMGTTTTYGTGNYNWTLPTTAATITGFSGLPIWTGSVMCLDAGTAYKLGVLSIASAGTTLTVLTDSAGTAWGQTIPQTWANTDYLAMNFIYEPAV